ncbi:MAG: hypothetical protein MUE85_08770 [Microscillaceae bacterium]|jgi:hypothetical protein|nr:hypothetical protein [Microscillaceae bacterium]
MSKKAKAIDLSESLLAKTFGLTRVFEPTLLLAEWLKGTGETLNKLDYALLQKIIPKLIKNADYWNEEELKMQFISIIILLGEFESPIQTYYEREISTSIQNILLKIEADMLLSKGIGDLIETPYFFLHEYKREKKYSGDPIGQMLGGMLIGQALNENKKPMYGCYVQGRYWYFAILEDKKYVISNSYNASEEPEVIQIVMILRKLKTIILERLSD